MFASGSIVIEPGVQLEKCLNIKIKLCCLYIESVVRLVTGHGDNNNRHTLAVDIYTHLAALISKTKDSHTLELHMHLHPLGVMSGHPSSTVMQLPTYVVSLIVTCATSRHWICPTLSSSRSVSK